MFPNEFRMKLSIEKRFYEKIILDIDTLGSYAYHDMVEHKGQNLFEQDN